MNSETIYAKESGSSLPKIFVISAAFMILAGGLHILYADPLFPGYAPEPGNPLRSVLLAITMILTSVRMLFTLSYLLRRSMNWEEAMGIPFAFLLYFIFFSVLVRFNAASTGWLEWTGLAFFIAGSCLNTGSELGRHFWKRRAENKGKLYTKGPFSLARHINYTGDIIWVTGMACITGSIYSVPVILFVFSFFAFFNGPMLDKYLKQKYGEQYRAWAQNTKSLIPGIF